MIQLISEHKASNIFGGYYSLLSKTGYVSRKVMRSLLMYLFILDMVEYMHGYITSEDYKLIEAALGFLARNSCLLPYSVFCTNRATLKTDKALLAKRKPVSSLGVRVTENVVNKPANNYVIVNV